MTARQPVTGLLRDVVAEVLEAIGDELSALATDEASAVDLRRGRRVGVVGSAGVWSFEFDGGLPVLPETPGRLTVDGREPVTATVLAVGDLDLVLGVEDDLGDSLVRARLSVEPWFILDALRNRLRDMLDGPVDTPLVEALLDLRDPEPGADGGPGIAADAVPLPLGPDQLRAAAHAARPGLRFVWGPPGTGKTSTLAATVARLAAAEGPGNVLVVAHANAAVDVAIARIADALAGSALLAEGRVLRVGTAHLDVARNRPEILPDRIIARGEPELVRRRDTLERERRQLSRALKAAAVAEQQALAERLAAVRKEHAAVEHRLREARTALVRRAAVVATTLSKLVLDDVLWAQASRAVVVDEASMSGLPFVLAAALRGASTLACFGDFRQLPPIAVAETGGAQRWFGTDVFDLSGVTSRLEAGVPDDRLAMLRTQYRMGRDIAAVVSDFAYSSLLRSDPGVAEVAGRTAALPPAPGAEVVVVDTSPLRTACLREADVRSFSRFNLLSAALAATAAHGLVASGAATVGIVSPYRAQARVLAALSRGTVAIAAATAHRFQGAERDAIVADLVDAPPARGPSRLTGRDPGLARRLLNVGASRAKGKLVVVADVDFVARHHPQGSPSQELLRLCRDHGATVLRGDELVGEAAVGETVTWLPGWECALSRLMERARGSPTRFEICIADEGHAGDWLDRLAVDLPARGHALTVRAPVPVAIRLEESRADLRLKTLGPAPLAFAGDEALVVGGDDPTGWTAYITSTAAVAAARRLLLAE